MTKAFAACYTWGRHLGMRIDTCRPAPLPKSIGEISQVSIGINHCGLVTQKGEIYTFGSNSLRHLTHKTTSHPTLVPLESSVQVQCGDNFTIALSQKGEVFSWGSIGSRSLWSHLVGKRHCLGVETNMNIYTPKQIKLNENILEIACGRDHCLALGKFNVYAWGINDFGQLGEGPIFGYLKLPSPISFFQKSGETIAKISAAEYSSAVLTSTGKVYVWGSNKEGQLGLPDVLEMQIEPKLIPMTEILPIKDLYLGSSSMMLLTETNEVYVCGLNIWKKFEKFEVPGGLEPMQVCCGDDFFAVLCKGSKIAYFGGVFSLEPLLLDMPDSTELTKSDFIPGEIQRLEGKYGYMAAITEISSSPPPAAT